ncbi:MAG: phospho-N-acetylmuramoyl-pentapeptide-transferase [Candidatus Tritonobacter lacicola]|nr:phospho-N-acetylmuramoyl-pentapeptide-transferase [Candidatus Tritonobacter lacicola]
MLYYIFYPLREYFFAFNVFRYITFRAVFAAVTALLISLVMGPPLIRVLARLGVGQEVRDDGPRSHLSKAGTPTMGGVLILASVIIATLLWADIFNRFVVIALASTVVLGALGFCDDLKKVRRRRSLGLSGKSKLVVQTLLAAGIAGYLMWCPATRSFITELTVPFLKVPVVANLGLLYVVLAFLVIVGSSNAVNLTDGLDGLAIGCVIIAALSYSVMSYVVGNVKFAAYLQLRYVAGSGELAIFCAAIVGAGLGFLWYNAPPAEVFMGDTGSLALGGAVGVVALLIKKELVLLLVGGIFVLEALSVLIQVASFKLTGRRVFLCAPLHHHFELRGWSETKVTIRFWIVAIIFALFSLATLKLQ